MVFLNTFSMLSARFSFICSTQKCLQSPPLNVVVFADLLQYLVDTKRLAQIVKILPARPTEATAADGSGVVVAVDAVDDRLFGVYLTAAIDRDRAERLGEMIKTTGYQLNETYNRNKQYFN